MSSTSPTLTGFGPEQAAAYDARFAKLEPMRDALHLLAAAILARLPSGARILCVGAGTGAELLALGARFPGRAFHRCRAVRADAGPVPEKGDGRGIRGSL